MKIGLQVMRFDWPGSPVNIGPKLAEIGKTADSAGFDSLWMMDHFFQMDRPEMGLRAQYADACNLAAFMGMEELARKLDVLKRHCDDLGRDYDEIEKTAIGFVKLGEGGSSPADLIAQCQALADLGMDTFIFSIGNVQDITPIEMIGREVIPAVAGF